MKKKSSQVVLANLTIGLQLGITIFIFVYLGYRLDIYYHKSPYFLATGTVLGMVTGFYHLLKSLKNN